LTAELVKLILFWFLFLFSSFVLFFYYIFSHFPQNKVVVVVLWISLTLPYQLALQPFVGLGLLHQQPPSNKIGSGFTYKSDFPIHHLPVGSDWFA
jgi:hypothetical protein